MNIKINNKETEVKATSLQELATEISLPEKGVAVAVNNRMVTRADWNHTAINDGDNIVVIKAVCGG
ncbi:sulfur carrier protein ThiS [Prevotella sp.]|uniref:sulfur carrier protein ThiS n=1 Tax=uncultured Prevotella sp. TaxID=159272 RepID=UPI0025DE718F|nr:sulfur carrier protein ThiS [Prevotella sp.]MCI7118468.1 sulfur carrier protein ThiS [Prevotella sp.]